MGEHIARSNFDERERMVFVQHLIDDIKSLETMIKERMIESDVVRI